jgi:phage terminase large subunit
VISGQEIEKIASALEAGEPVRSPSTNTSGDWKPNLNKTQEDMFNDAAKFILAAGEKGSGKTVGLLYKLVRHCYENENAFALIISPSIRTGKEGVLFDLENMVLPDWGAGIGLDYTLSRLDPNTKDRHLWIANMHNGWSRVLLVSIPYAEAVEPRVKGMSPSFVYVDELTHCPGREYFTYVAAQLGRRRNIIGPQQYTASCNPDGPSHWVHRVFYEECFDEETGDKDEDFSVYHVPISENVKNLPEQYVKSLNQILKHDPVEQRRLLFGEWVDRPTGEALFKEYFNADIHVRGDGVANTGLHPVAGHPIVIGYDLGQVNSSVTFTQLIPTSAGNIWLVFDEIDHIGEKILYKRLAQEILAKMNYWTKRKKYPFRFQHISDSSAINQWHPGGSGSYDSWDMERYSDGQIKLIGCPKGKGSVEARIRLLTAKLFQDEIYISATCANTIDMLNQLESDKKDAMKPKRSKWIHKFDSLSYPLLKLELNGQRAMLSHEDHNVQLIHCGSG